VPIDRDVLDAVRDMDQHDLRRLLILARSRLEALGDDFGSVAPNVRIRAQYVRCGKEGCTRCPHGPYWYAYWSENGRRRSRYIGKLDAGTAKEIPSPADGSTTR
jgi:hypothetical protein